MRVLGWTRHALIPCEGWRGAGVGGGGGGLLGVGKGGVLVGVGVSYEAGLWSPWRSPAQLPCAKVCVGQSATLQAVGWTKGCRDNRTAANPEVRLRECRAAAVWPGDLRSQFLPLQTTLRPAGKTPVQTSVPSSALPCGPLLRHDESGTEMAPWTLCDLQGPLGALCHLSFPLVARWALLLAHPKR